MPTLTQPLKYSVDLDKPTQEWRLEAPLVKGDRDAHELIVAVTRAGALVPLTDVNCICYAVLANKQTVLIKGAVAAGEARATLSAGCYSVPGRISLLLQLTTPTQTFTPLCLTGNVCTGATDALLDPDDVVPSLGELLKQVNGIEAATAAAATAASEANRAAAEAGAAKNNANTAAAEAGMARNNANTAAGVANAAAASISTLTADAEAVAAGGQPTVRVTEVSGHKHFTFGSVTGEQGAAFLILGSAYATLTALQAGVSNPKVGDQYNVGSAPPYFIYRWTGTAWENEGVLQGQRGEAGADGLTTSVNGVAQVNGNVVINGANIAVNAVDSMKLDVAIAKKTQYTPVYHNASPGSTFASQTLALDLSKYSGVLIEYCAHILTIGYKPCVVVAKGGECLATQLFNDGKQASRNVICNAKGLFFGDAYIRSANTSGVGFVENIHMVPFRIFGMSGVF